MKDIDAMVKTVIVRYGELALKSEPTRMRFERCLREDIKSALNGLSFELRRERGRIFISTSSPRSVIRRLVRLPGIVSVSPSVEVEARIEAISSAALNLARKSLSGKRSFAVRTSRVGSHTFTSRDVNTVVGSLILKKIPEIRVNLSEPDQEIFIEIRGERAYVFTEVFSGPGGLPVSTQGKVVALISGRVEGAIASWLMMKRGCKVIPIFFDARPYADARAKRLAVKIVKFFRAVEGSNIHFLVVPYGELLGVLSKNVQGPLICPICIRGMYKISEILADEEKAEGVVTGEGFDDLNSLEYLRILQYGVRIPIFRPLFSFDEGRIEKIAEQARMREFLSYPAGQSCSLFPRCLPDKVSLREVLDAEEKLNLNELFRKIAKNAEKIQKWSQWI
jgi:thiamine biosynthesis protein ThiI